jgi:hypothetical protein
MTTAPRPGTPLVRQRNPLKPDDRRLRHNKQQQEQPAATAPPPVGPKRLEPLPWQRALLSVPDQYDLLLSGGRGGGKSTGLVLLLLRDVLRFGRNFNGALVRRDLAGLRKLQREIEDQIAVTPELRGSHFVTSAKEFRFSNGATLFLHYLKDEASFNRFQGQDLTHCYIDESGQIADPAPILRLRSSMRTTTAGLEPRMVLTCNPNNAGSYWHYENFIRRMTPWQPTYIELFQKECVLIHSTLFDNPHIVDRDGYISSLKAACNFDEAKVQSEVYGSWGQVSGSFFSHVWDKNRIALPDWDGIPTWADGYSDWNLWMGLDWGTRSPSALVLAYRTPQMIWWKGRRIGPGSIVLVDEHYTCLTSPDGSRQWNTGDRELTTTKLAEAARELCRRNGITLEQVPVKHRIADAAIGAEIGGDSGSIGAQLKRHGAEFRAGPKGKRAPGWQLMARMLEAAGDWTTAGLYATPKVESFWATVPGLQYAPHNPEDLDSTGPDHVADAVRYLLQATHDPRYTFQPGGTKVRVW